MKLGERIGSLSKIKWKKWKLLIVAIALWLVVLLDTDETSDYPNIRQRFEEKYKKRIPDNVYVARFTRSEVLIDAFHKTDDLIGQDPQLGEYVESNGWKMFDASYLNSIALIESDYEGDNVYQLRNPAIKAVEKLCASFKIDIRKLTQGLDKDVRDTFYARMYLAIVNREFSTIFYKNKDWDTIDDSEMKYIMSMARYMWPGSFSNFMKGNEVYSVSKIQSHLEEKIKTELRRYNSDKSVDKNFYLLDLYLTETLDMDIKEIRADVLPLIDFLEQSDSYEPYRHWKVSIKYLH